MSARVNLLPRDGRERTGAGGGRVLALLLVLVVIAGLALATFWQRGVLQDAEDELADARAELSAAQAEVAALSEFEDLRQLLEETDNLLVGAMADEVTLAGLLQDIALVTPPQGAFTSMSINFTEDGAGNVGTFSGNAEALASHAPGVERFLLQLERSAGFRNVYPGSSTIDEDDIATFSVTVQLGPEYRTDRYSDGLPEGIR